MQAETATPPADTPGSARAKPWLGERLVLAAYIVGWLVYFGYRLGYTLDGASPWLAIPLLLAEVVGFVSSIVFYALMGGPRQREAVRPPALPPPRHITVDVLIATYNEDLALVRKTALAARDMAYPHQTYICDDGRRPEMAALAAELGVGYLTRPDNRHYKAGNLNHAMSRTDGEVIAIFDADHVPTSRFLTRLLGYFSDPRVALVQVPQIYYNIDSFQHSLYRRRVWHESATFHHLILPGLAARSAAPFLGTGAIWRRIALESVGGIAVGSITEDVLTSMRAQAAGWRSVVIDKPLAFLLAPDTPVAYAQQRLRWAQGNLQLLRTENPLRKSGLGFWQKLAYTNMFAGYLTSFAHLVFYLAPAAFLLGGLVPMRLDGLAADAIVLMQIFLSVLVWKRLATPYASIVLSECFRLLNLPIHLRASVALLFPADRPFRVTPKGRHGGLPLWLIAPIVVITVANVLAAGTGLAALVALGRAGALVPGDFLLLAASGWAAFFALAGALMLRHIFARRTLSDAFAFLISLPSELKVVGSGSTRKGVVLRLNDEMAYVALDGPQVEPGSLVEMDLGESGRVLAGVVSHEQASDGSGLVTLRFARRSEADVDAQDHHWFNHALPVLFNELAKHPDAPAMPVDVLQVRSELV
jgi:cellulose synthase/poly-beta-1,6-N-acetylglucosamine synthase-like glycosyltransferase